MTVLYWIIGVYLAVAVVASCAPYVLLIYENDNRYRQKPWILIVLQSLGVGLLWPVWALAMLAQVLHWKRKR